MSSIFLSHNHKDKPFVRRLSERLQAYGIRTWVDEAEMRVGDSLISKIEIAIQKFKYLGVVLSPNSISSDWVRREVNIALTEEFQGRRVKVLPLLYKKCEIPGFLADKLYADFTEDFEEGLEKLLARLSSDLHEEEHKQKRTYEILLSAYQDWISFEKQDFHLLDKDKIALVVQYVNQPKLALNLMEFLFCSISKLSISEGIDFDRLKGWVDEIDKASIADLFHRLLEHPDPQVRVGAITLIERLAITNAIDIVITKIKHESDTNTRRVGLHCVFRFNKSLPNELAEYVLNNDNDWLNQSYALRSLNGYRSCLLISDGTEFAAEIGALAKDSGFRLVTLSNDAPIYWEFEKIPDEILQTYEIVTLVRGEHYTQYYNEGFYSKLRHYVLKGGSLFATSWVSWETKYNNEFASILPFSHIADSFKENVEVTCKPAENELARNLFPNEISFRTSLELSRNRNGSEVLFETISGIPIFGYRPFGSGVCYYLNTCQHSCFGKMISPLLASPELRDCLQRVFEWINKSSKKLKSPEFSATIVELPTDVPTKDMSETENPPKNVYSVDQQIINLSRRLQKLREIQALKGIDLEPHYLIEIEDIEEELEELQKQRKDSVN